MLKLLLEQELLDMNKNVFGIKYPTMVDML